MALNANTYYSNSITRISTKCQVLMLMLKLPILLHGMPQVILCKGQDGNRFRYCHVGTATNSGLLVKPKLHQVLGLLMEQLLL